MAGKWDGQTCPVCGEGLLHDGSRATHTEYRGESFTVDQPGAYCDNCDEGVVYHDPGLETQWAEFRTRVDTEQAAELAAIRARLGLTQAQAAKITGGGHNAFSRYERMEAQPVVAVLNLFRLLDRHPSLVADLLPATDAAAAMSAAFERHLLEVTSKVAATFAPTQLAQVKAQVVPFSRQKVALLVTIDRDSLCSRNTGSTLVWDQMLTGDDDFRDQIAALPN